MSHLLVFTKKEINESWRTSKFLILVIIFLLFGVMNPLVAKFTPELLKMAGGGLKIELPAPTSMDSWTQFYKNINQMGLFVLALLFSGTVSQEVSSGTLVNLVTKGLKRWTVILSKFLNLFVQWTICLALCFGVTWGYTGYYFPDDLTPHLVAGVVPVWIFGVFLLALIIFGSTIARNAYEGLLITGASVVLLAIISILPKTKYY
ncbi:MAG: ABC transporter permease, partial [Enterococcus sp.]